MTIVARATLLTSTASIAALAAGAGATPALAQATLPVGTYQWSGFYAGLQAGGVWSDEDDGSGVGDCGPFSNLVTNTGNVFDSPDDSPFGCFNAFADQGPNAPNSFPTFLLGDGTIFNDADEDDYVAYTGGDRSSSHGNLGGIVGYNIQVGRFVYGVEADTSGVIGGSRSTTTFDYFDDGLSVDDDTFLLGNYFGSGTVTGTDLNWLTTLRTRAGVAVGPGGRVLVFGTTGLAIGNFENRFSATFDTSQATAECSDCTFTGSASGDETRVGVVLGGGIEYGITGNMRIGMQYTWTHFGSQSPQSITFVGDNDQQFDVNVGGSAFNVHAVSARFTWALNLP